MSGECSLRGKIAVITGANRGLGLAMTRRFLQHGARVVMVCRRPALAREALDGLAQDGVDVQGASVLGMDLARLDSVGEASEMLLKDRAPIDFLVLNAGVFRLPPQLNEDGLEKHFVINYLAHYLLTARLWPRILRSPSARIVGVNSSTEKHAPEGFLDPRSLQGQGPWTSYAFSKRCVLSFLLELDRRLQLQGLPHRALAADPGFVGTSLLASGGDASSAWARFRNAFMRFGGSVAGQSPERASLILWHACTASLDACTGLVAPGDPLGLWGKPRWKEPGDLARSAPFVDTLMDFSRRFAPCPLDRVEKVGRPV